jgi:hypothetical protein
MVTPVRVAEQLRRMQYGGAGCQGFGLLRRSGATVYPLWPMAGRRNGTRRTEGILFPSYQLIMHSMLLLRWISEAVAQCLSAVLDLRSTSSLKSSESSRDRQFVSVISGRVEQRRQGPGRTAMELWQAGGQALGGLLGDLQLSVYANPINLTPDFTGASFLFCRRPSSAGSSTTFNFLGNFAGVAALADVSARSYPCVKTIDLVGRCRVERRLRVACCHVVDRSYS